MKRPQVLGQITLGILLSLAAFAARVEASPYITHPIGPASRTFLSVLHERSAGSRQAPRLPLSFDPGIRDAIEASLPTSPFGASGPLPLNQSPDDHEAGRIDAPPTAPKNRTVPEPASIVLVVTGLIGLAARRHLLRNRPLA
ncbi:PEP-CTERM protein-sorting domain-containing protein [Singulisphaera sp. GP187]|uniref:PEP-CTERM sorting domain-containing protein n=1 Tax=Singulisphaera sp. GP187 TaxID=1882752 RepID=UPI00092978D4|nr:PEP-CTERM sorting domain-containing protein [Singulisphaera sp. GP187]SIO65762.1 PEP-CTERM protein-sorting domain-containing protein [Singulisphaera sp. GP187]